MSGPVRRVVARLVGEMGLDVDELGAVEIGLLAGDFVHRLRRFVHLVPAHDGLSHPIHRDAALLQRLDEAIDASSILVAPLLRAPQRAISRRGANMIAVGEADHDDADVERLATGALLGLHLVFEFSAGQAEQRAMLARHLHTAVAGKGLDEAVEQPFGKAVAIGLQLVDIAFRERRDVADARRLLLRSRGPCQRERQHHENRNEGCTDSAHFPYRPAKPTLRAVQRAPQPDLPSIGCPRCSGRSSRSTDTRVGLIPATARRQQQGRSWPAAVAQPA